MSFAQLSFQPQISAGALTGLIEAPPSQHPLPADSWPVAILGVPVANVTMGEAIARIESMVVTAVPHYVVTANVDFLVQARRDVELRRILIDADLVLCDGTPLVWASRCLRNPLPERVAGSDLVPKLLTSAAQKGWRVFLLGGAPEVAAAAAARLGVLYPSLALAGHYSPPFQSLLQMDHAETVQRIRAAKPDLLLVSFGCPKQEKWIAMHYRALGVPVVIGVGATIDFLAGRLPRAPAWMSQTGLEWLFRLRQEPRRLLRRYISDAVRFLPALAGQAWRLARARVPVSPSPPQTSFTTEHWLRVRVGRNFTAAALKADKVFWRDMLHYRRHCLLDLAAVRSIDSTGAALLLDWRRQLRVIGRQLVLLYPSEAVRRALRELRVEEFFHLAFSLAQAQEQVADAIGLGPPVVASGPGPSALSWQGEITAANAEGAWLVTALHLITRGKAPGEVPIDLSGLRFMDTSGAGLVLRVARLARQFDTEVRFIGAQRTVRNVWHHTQLSRTLAGADPPR